MTEEFDTLHWVGQSKEYELNAGNNFNSPSLTVQPGQEYQVESSTADKYVLQSCVSNATGGEGGVAIQVGQSTIIQENSSFWSVRWNPASDSKPQPCKVKIKRIK